MTWQMVHSASFEGNIGVVEIDYLFKKPIFILEAICLNAKPTWYKAGFICPVWEFPNVGKVNGKYQTVNFKKQIIRFDQLEQFNFTVEFIAHDWIPDITLNFWETTMPLYQLTTTTVNPNATTSFVTTAPSIDTTAKKIVSANSERKELTIYNPDLKNSVYVDLANTVSTATAAFIIPPGQLYVADIHWTGEVWGITKTGSITLTVREFF